MSIAISKRDSRTAANAGSCEHFNLFLFLNAAIVYKVIWLNYLVGIGEQEVDFFAVIITTFNGS